MGEGGGGCIYFYFYLVGVTAAEYKIIKLKGVGERERESNI